MILLHAPRLLANTFYRGFCTANARLDYTALSDGLLLRLLVRLGPFRRIYPGQPDLVLAIAGVQKGEGVTVGDLYHAAGKGVGQ